MIIVNLVVLIIYVDSCFRIVSKTLMWSLMRRANGVAHELAKVASSNTNPHIHDDVPSCIWHILVNEMHWFVYFKKKKLECGWTLT